MRELEGRFQQLERTVHTHHQEQVQHNTTIAQTVQHLSLKIDSQASSYQTHLDQRMQEQLAHIERMLALQKHE